MLSSGAVAGIVIGSLVGLIIFIGVPLYVILRRRKAAASLTQNSGSATPGVKLSTPHPPAVVTTQESSNEGPATKVVAPASNVGAFVPYDSHGEPSEMLPIGLSPGASVDSIESFELPQLEQMQSYLPHARPTSHEIEISSGRYNKGGSGQEPVNYGSMQVKGIRDVKGDREPGPTW